MGEKELISKLKTKGIVPGLKAMEDLLDVLSHPEDSLSVIHIAGTNGKGSVCAFLSRILMEAGFRVGRYVSPTISCYEEHFQINESFIGKDRLSHYYDQVEEAISVLEEGGRATPTLFEAETAIALMYFKDEKVDYAIIETGMGGLMDATNVIQHPVLTIITSISYDHMAYLGDTLAEIAGQKAGIIKPHVPVILSENPQEAAAVVEEKARECDSPLIRVSPGDYEILFEDYDGSSFVWKDQEYRISLPGSHQISNAVTALSAASLLLSTIPPAAFPQGLDMDEILKIGLYLTRWPGRLEITGRNPLIYRDGAHNADGALRLSEFLQKHFTNRRIIYIIGVLKDKEYEKMLASMMPLADRAYCFCPNNERGLDADILADCVRSFGKEAVVCADVNEALDAALKYADRQDVLVVWGSLSFMEDMR